MAQTLETMHDLFNPMVRSLNAAEFAPSGPTHSDESVAFTPPDTVNAP
jgi:hypothetical protein